LWPHEVVVLNRVVGGHGLGPRGAQNGLGGGGKATCMSVDFESDLEGEREECYGGW